MGSIVREFFLLVSKVSVFSLFMVNLFSKNHFSTVLVSEFTCC